MSRRKYLDINAEWCKGCGICVAFCPRNVLEMNDAEKVEAVRIEDCSYCGDCEVRCPDFAIAVVREAAS